MTKNEINIDDLIENNYVVPQSDFDRTRTKTTHFMMNTIFPNNSTLINTEYFINCFLDDEEFGHNYSRPIFILFKANPNDQKWGTVASKLRTKPEYIIEYFCGTSGNRNLIMMIFQVPIKWAREYINFKAGKYSKFSEDYKKLFNRYVRDEQGKSIESTIWKVLHKSESLRKDLQDWIGNGSKDYKFTEKDELWGIPTPKYEYYRHVEKTEDCLA